MKPPAAAPLFPHLRPVAGPGWTPAMFPGRAMVEPPPPWATPHGDGAAISPSPSPSTGRWCYRCTHCLDVVFTGERIAVPVEVATCGACGGPLESMGEVYRARLTDTVERCACDYRCTGAAGPHCDCHCGGANHGSGRVVEVRRDLGPVPTLRGQCDPGELRRRGDQYRAALADARQLAATLAPGPAWSLRQAVRACKEGRTHARVGKLRAITLALDPPR